MKCKKNEEGVPSENNRQREKDRNQTNRQAQKSPVLFCSDHKPKSESMRVHCWCVSVCMAAAESLCLFVRKLYGK